jgi:acyl-CoA dehydrogenase
MDFTIPPQIEELQARTRRFIRERIIPLEADPRQTRHGPTDEFRRELNALAAAEGLVAPHVSPEYGGLGLNGSSPEPRARASPSSWPRTRTGTPPCS